MRPIDADKILYFEAITDTFEPSGEFYARREDIRAMPTIKPESQWIPCSERLPEEWGDYLVTKKMTGCYFEEYQTTDIAYYDRNGFHKADTVIAWMPLPEAYREEGEKE